MPGHITVSFPRSSTTGSGAYRPSSERRLVATETLPRSMWNGGCAARQNADDARRVQLSVSLGGCASWVWRLHSVDLLRLQGVASAGVQEEG